jgi:hypothetical protein
MVEAYSTEKEIQLMNGWTDHYRHPQFENHNVPL